MPYFARTRPAPQVRGGYRTFRPHVRADFRRRCAYCLFAELLAAGEENFELDHFRPQSVFPSQKNDFYNIYYACHPCNHIKRDVWPSSEMEARGLGFVDLCTDEFATHFKPRADGTWEGVTESGRYTIDMLRLNRGHLITLRRRLKQLGFDIHEIGTDDERLKVLLLAPPPSSS